MGPPKIGSTTALVSDRRALLNRRRAAGLLFIAMLGKTHSLVAAGVGALQSRASPVIAERIKTNGSCKVLIRLAARELIEARRRETDEIYADRSTTLAQKQTLNDAAGQRYRAKLTAMKAAFAAAMDSDEIEVIGDVPSGPEVRAIVRSLEALGRLTSDPSVEFVFAEEAVKLP